MEICGLTFAKDHRAVDDVDDLDLEVRAAGDDGPVVGAELDGLDLPCVRGHLLYHLEEWGTY